MIHSLLNSRKFLIVAGVVAFVAWALWLAPRDRPVVPAADTPASTMPDSASVEKPAPEDRPATRAPAAQPAAKPDVEPASRVDSPQVRRTAAEWSVAADVAQGQPAVPASPLPGVEGQLAISGRVLNLIGDPVPGIEVTAHAMAPNGRAVAADSQQGGRSDEDGVYRIEGLTPGDYQVSTTARGGYASFRKTFRAGLESADIILASSTRVELHGRVTDARGRPLAEVEVSPSGRSAVQVRTDAGGGYRTQLTVTNPAASYTIRFRRAGYREELVNLPARELAAQGEYRLDVELQAEQETATVSGKIRSERGDSVAGETVQLQSQALGTRYTGSSNQDGAFTMSAVEPGSDYRVTIHPRGAYENYWQQDVVINRPSASLDITLKSMDSGRLTGRIIDVEGYPVAGFSLQLKSNKSQRRYVTVTSDESGYFTVEDAPSGSLMFFTQSEPRLSITGITLEARTAANAEVVVDWGDDDLAGRVRDQSMGPVAGATVRLTWRHSHGATQSTSLRSAVTDAAGYFRFSQLGPGPHLLEVSAPGYHSAKENHTVGGYLGEVQVTLREGSD